MKKFVSVILTLALICADFPLFYAFAENRSTLVYSGMKFSDTGLNSTLGEEDIIKGYTFKENVFANQLKSKEATVLCGNTSDYKTAKVGFNNYDIPVFPTLVDGICNVKHNDVMMNQLYLSYDNTNSKVVDTGNFTDFVFCLDGIYSIDKFFYSGSGYDSSDASSSATRKYEVYFSLNADELFSGTPYITCNNQENYKYQLYSLATGTKAKYMGLRILDVCDPENFDVNNIKANYAYLRATEIALTGEYYGAKVSAVPSLPEGYTAQDVSVTASATVATIGDQITYTASATNKNLIFCGWENESGNIVSQNATYTVDVTSEETDTEYKAVFYKKSEYGIATLKYDGMQYASTGLNNPAGEEDIIKGTVFVPAVTPSQLNPGEATILRGSNPQEDSITTAFTENDKVRLPYIVDGLPFDKYDIMEYYPYYTFNSATNQIEDTGTYADFVFCLNGKYSIDKFFFSGSGSDGGAPYSSATAKYEVYLSETAEALFKGDPAITFSSQKYNKYQLFELPTLPTAKYMAVRIIDVCNPEAFGEGNIKSGLAYLRLAEIGLFGTLKSGTASASAKLPKGFTIADADTLITTEEPSLNQVITYSASPVHEGLSFSKWTDTDGNTVTESNSYDLKYTGLSCKSDLIAVYQEKQPKFKLTFKDFNDTTVYEKTCYSSPYILTNADLYTVLTKATKAYNKELILNGDLPTFNVPASTQFTADTTLTIQYKDANNGQKIISEKYKVSEQYIAIENGTPTVAAYNYILAKDVAFKRSGVTLKETEKIKTNDTVEVLTEGEVTDTKTVLTKGDGNFDGKLTVSDVVKARSVILNKNSTDKINTALDFDNSDNISVTDVVSLVDNIINPDTKDKIYSLDTSYNTELLNILGGATNIGNSMSFKPMNGIEFDAYIEGDIKAEFSSAGSVCTIVDNNEPQAEEITMGENTFNFNLTKGKHHFVFINTGNTEFTVSNASFSGKICKAANIKETITYFGNSFKNNLLEYKISKATNTNYFNFANSTTIKKVYEDIASAYAPTPNSAADYNAGSIVAINLPLVDNISLAKSYIAKMIKTVKFNNNNAKILLLTANGNDYTVAFSVANYFGSKANGVFVYDNSKGDEKSLENQINYGGIIENGFYKEVKTLTSGQKSELPANNISKNKIITLSADVKRFTELHIGNGGNGMNANYISITKDKISSYLYGKEYRLTDECKNTLNITDKIFVTIDIHIGVADIIVSDGSDNVTLSATWYGEFGAPFVESVGSSLSNVKLSLVSPDYGQDIHIYGDSYMGDVLYQCCWSKYLLEGGHHNNLIDAFPGKASKGALETLKLNLQIATPKYIVWSVGMNDADSNTEVNANWLNCIKEVEKICKEKGITLILTLVPNVPERNNNFKNSYVKKSGYRYIDFCGAVGADKNTSWNAGLLGPDNVHPSAEGAKILCEKALKDFPELN